MKDPRKLRIWVALIVLSLGFAYLLHLTGFPAAFLIGPMLVAMVFGARGARLAVARPFMLCSQAVIGVLVASSLDPDTLTVIADNAPSIVLVVATTVLFSTFAGWLMARTRLLPGTTAAWGCAPGAATGMVALSEEYGADPRMVALMQFLRVTMVVVIATLVSRLVFGVNALEASEGTPFLSGFDRPLDLLATIGTIFAGALAARLLSIPSGGVFIPLAIAFTLQSVGLLTITLPPWLLLTAFTLIGLWVGLKFERETVLYALRVLPIMLVGSISLILLCGVSAAMLVWLVGTDPLTAYLATTPGALEAVTIIAVSSNADISFILALQTVRLFVVIVTGPMLAKMICRMI